MFETLSVLFKTHFSDTDTSTLKLGGKNLPSIPRETARKRTERLRLRHVSKSYSVHVPVCFNRPISSVNSSRRYYACSCGIYILQDGIAVRNRLTIVPRRIENLEYLIFEVPYGERALLYAAFQCGPLKLRVISHPTNPDGYCIVDTLVMHD